MPMISFDFKKAFDKSPHRHFLRALSCMGLCGSAYMICLQAFSLNVLNKCVSEITYQPSVTPHQALSKVAAYALYSIPY